jgi:hypothetical protein
MVMDYTSEEVYQGIKGLSARKHMRIARVSALWKPTDWHLGRNMVEYPAATTE